MNITRKVFNTLTQKLILFIFMILFSTSCSQFGAKYAGKNPENKQMDEIFKDKSENPNIDYIQNSTLQEFSNHNNGNDNPNNIDNDMLDALFKEIENNDKTKIKKQEEQEEQEEQKLNEDDEDIFDDVFSEIENNKNKKKEEIENEDDDIFNAAFDEIQNNGKLKSQTKNETIGLCFVGMGCPKDRLDKIINPVKDKFQTKFNIFTSVSHLSINKQVDIIKNKLDDIKFKNKKIIIVGNSMGTEIANCLLSYIISQKTKQILYFPINAIFNGIPLIDILCMNPLIANMLKINDQQGIKDLNSISCALRNISNFKTLNSGLIKIYPIASKIPKKCMQKYYETISNTIELFGLNKNYIKNDDTDTLIPVKSQLGIMNINKKLVPKSLTIEGLHEDPDSLPLTILCNIVKTVISETKLKACPDHPDVSKFVLDMITNYILK